MCRFCSLVQKPFAFIVVAALSLVVVSGRPGAQYLPPLPVKEVSAAQSFQQLVQTQLQQHIQSQIHPQVESIQASVPLASFTIQSSGQQQYQSAPAPAPAPGGGGVFTQVNIIEPEALHSRTLDK